MNRENMPLVEVITGQILMIGAVALQNPDTHPTTANVAAVGALIALDGVRRLFKGGNNVKKD